MRKKNYNYNRKNYTTDEILSFIGAVAPDEQFKQLKQHKFYYVSNYGRMASCYFKEPRLVTPHKNKSGSLYFDLTVGKYNHVKYYVHRLVAENFCVNDFIDYEFSKLQIHHKDGNPANNYYKNLMIVNPKSHKAIQPYIGKKVYAAVQTIATTDIEEFIAFISEKCFGGDIEEACQWLGKVERNSHSTVIYPLTSAVYEGDNVATYITTIESNNKNRNSRQKAAFNVLAEAIKG